MDAIIGLVGFKGAGKDTVAQYLVDHYGFTSLAFADPIKDCLSILFGWDREMLSGRTPESRKWREEVDLWWASRLGIPHFSPRWAMTNFGSDVMRRVFHDDIWVINMERRIRDTSGPIVISDLRFAIEFEMLRRLSNRVGIYRIQRGSDPIWMDVALAANHGDLPARKMLIDELGIHQSEWEWIGKPLNGTILNEGSVEQLHANAEQILLEVL